MLADGTLVVDGVAHAYNWSEPNWINAWSPRFSAAGFGLHCLMSRDDETRLTEQEFIDDWRGETLSEVFFTETDVDLVSYHSVPLHDYYHDGLSCLEKGKAMKAADPDRVLLYGFVNPLEGEKALDQIREHADNGVTALKLYPARYYEGRTIPNRLDDPTMGPPVIELALKLGMKAIACHKAIPFGPTRSSHYRTDDFDEMASLYPEMNFEVVHGGFAFTEETAFLLGRFPNVWVNLEVTASLLMNNPRRFAEVMGQFLYWGGGDRILFASGCSFVHPQPVIDALLAFQIPEDMQEGYGYPAITDAQKRAILGANFCRLHGIDMEAAKAKIANDRWSQKRQAEGRRAPWATIRNGA